MLKMHAKITYQLTDGVIIGDKFLNKEDFRQAFLESLKNGEVYSRLLKEFEVLKIVEKEIINKKQQKVTVKEFVGNLDRISNVFSEEMFLGGKLGGDISLLTSFNIGSKEQATYFLSSEDDLYSSINDEKRKVYRNTLNSLRQLQKEGKNLIKFNDTLQQHLNNFSVQLQEESTMSNPKDRQRLYKWSYVNARKLLARKSEKTLSKYFWGDGHAYGYINEAFGVHLGLFHRDFYSLNEIPSVSKSVIAEHGGPGSASLYSLLQSTKGNTMSQLSGDIVFIDGNGNVELNIQSKASKKSHYSFTITYQKFLYNIGMFLKIYKAALETGKIEDEALDKLFMAFSTKAWTPVLNTLNQKINEEANNIIKN